MFRMTLYGHRLSNGGLTDSHLPLDVPGGSPDLGYLRRVPLGHNPRTRVNHPHRIMCSRMKCPHIFSICCRWKT